jgi:hypothetical protein
VRRVAAGFPIARDPHVIDGKDVNLRSDDRHVITASSERRMIKTKTAKLIER